MDLPAQVDFPMTTPTTQPVEGCRKNLPQRYPIPASRAVQRGCTAAAVLYPVSVIGFLNINKPPGPTSHDVVASVRRMVGRAVNVGHCGTLDPFAQGVLVVCLGGACRLTEFIHEQPKGYQADIRLGAVSETDDPQGPLTATVDPLVPPEAHLHEVIGTFLGTISQLPPSHSAVHVGGRRAYDLARQGHEFQLQPRDVVIHDIRLLSYAWPTATIEVTCGSGTYIRSLARDIGRQLGCGGYCSRLVRTRVGVFGIEQSKPMAGLRLPDDITDAATALPALPHIRVDGPQVPDVMLGKLLALQSPCPPGYAAILDPSGMMIGLGEITPDGLSLRPRRVFPVIGPVK